jgi:magnesium transporter
MLTVYLADQKKLKKNDMPLGSHEHIVWVDLFNPTREEEHQIETALKLELPTREEMQEIEISSRLYKEEDSLFMTATLLSNTQSDVPEAMPVTFVLTNRALVTIRYSEPKSFELFSARCQRSGDFITGEAALTGLLETVVDRMADVLEQIATDIDKESTEIFKPRKGRRRYKRNYPEILRRVGHKGDLNSKARESLVSLGRLLSFLAYNLDPSKTISRDLKSRIKTLSQDIHSLTDHASFLSNKIGFMLDATLGMINIEQNGIIKIFSVAAVVFLPPTLVASVYGMNFKFMPELEWAFGYPFAIGVMICSAIVPYLYFKSRGWL